MKRHALFAGVNTYDDRAIRPLRYSIPDASVLADRFGRLGFRTRLLPDPTRQQLLAAVEEGTEGLGRGDVFLFFFAGHGFTAQDGAHLLFCRDDRKRMLRVNSAGVRVDALELLTGEGGFHRAFLLDSCRSDAFADEDARGEETRDLDFVAMPESSTGTGTFFLLRSCDRFQPSLEISGFGHGLFTQGLLDAMDAADPALALCGDAFAGAIRGHMDELVRRESVATRQRPVSEINGPAFPLFRDGVFGTAATTGSKPEAVPECATCGRRLTASVDQFTCRKCGKRHCFAHQDAETLLCGDCAAATRAEEQRAAAEAEAAERARIVREEAARRAAETPGRPSESHEDAMDGNTSPGFLGRLFRVGETRHESPPGQGLRAGDVETLTLPGGAEMEMVWCPPGTFMMGSSTGQKGRTDRETLHQVTLTKGFWMAKYPVTQAQWTSVMGTTVTQQRDKADPSAPLSGKGNNYPMYYVNWHDAQKFCRKCRNAGIDLRLPTEAQWEYACRAGRTGPYGGTGRPDEMGWHDDNSGGRTHPVGKKKPNAWGLYDMHGNVLEWCADRYGAYPNGTVRDPKGALFGANRVIRGGCWDWKAAECRSAARDTIYPSYVNFDLGFRPARILS